MPTKKTRMGYEGQVLIGTAGVAATTVLTNVVDFDYNMDPERGDTTTRGDGTTVPIVTSRVVAIKPTLTLKMLNKPDDTELAQMLAAASTGSPIAMKTKSYSSGKGFDGDVTLTVKNGAPLRGEGTFEFTAEATEESTRAPQLWVT
jgi:hypothetical protein